VRFKTKLEALYAGALKPSELWKIDRNKIPKLDEEVK